MDNKVFRILTSIIPSNYLIDAMKEVRQLASLGERLRKRKNIPLRQPLLNYAFGGTKLFLSDELIELLAESLNIYDLGYKFYDKNAYYIHEVKPEWIEEENWDFEREEKLWVALDFTIPEWLAKIGSERKKQRQEIYAKQKQEANDSLCRQF